MGLSDYHSMALEPAKGALQDLKMRVVGICGDILIGTPPKRLM
jgi:hypothetical protein